MAKGDWTGLTRLSQRMPGVGVSGEAVDIGWACRSSLALLSMFLTLVAGSMVLRDGWEAGAR